MIEKDIWIFALMLFYMVGLLEVFTMERSLKEREGSMGLLNRLSWWDVEYIWAFSVPISFYFPLECFFSMQASEDSIMLPYYACLKSLTKSQELPFQWFSQSDGLLDKSLLHWWGYLSPAGELFSFALLYLLLFCCIMHTTIRNNLRDSSWSNMNLGKQRK